VQLDGADLDQAQETGEIVHPETEAFIPRHLAGDLSKRIPRGLRTESSKTLCWRKTSFRHCPDHVRRSGLMI